MNYEPGKGSIFYFTIKEKSIALDDKKQQEENRLLIFGMNLLIAIVGHINNN